MIDGREKRLTANDDGLNLEDVDGVGESSGSREVSFVEALSDVALYISKM
jgi:hypothetical protein